MTIKSTEEIIIYESPDGGKTIYSRHSGSSEKTLIKQELNVNQVARWYEWKEILKLAETNVTLKDAVIQAEMIYALIKKETN